MARATTFWQLVQQALEAGGISIHELARRVPCSVQSLYNWRHGRGWPWLQKRKALARELRVSLSELNRALRVEQRARRRKGATKP